MITAVNRAAASNSIRAGQMLADARAVLPALLTRPAEPERDAHALAQLALWLGRYGPSRNVEGQDGLWVDITGVAHLFGGEEALAKDCTGRLQRAGYHALLAIADTRSAAFALCRYGQTKQRILIALPGETRAALAALPVAGLQLTPDLVVLLRRLGLKRIGELYSLPRAALARRFRDVRPKATKKATVRNRSQMPATPRSAAAHAGWAQALVMRLDQALGELSEPARSIVEPPVYRVQHTYPEPLISHQGIVSALDDLAIRLCALLEEKHEGARALRFAICRADGTVAQISVGTSRPARDAPHIAALFNSRLERVDAGLGIDALVLEAMRTENLAREQKHFSGTDNSRAAPAVLIDRLVNRLGNKSVFYLDQVESHIPERAQKRIPALANCQVLSSGHDQQSTRRREYSDRPPFLLEPAEPITVIAEVPDGPPVRFTWRRITRRVTHAEGPERVAPEWWRLITCAGQVNGLKTTHLIRDYYRVEDEHGGRYWIYRAGLFPLARPDDQEKPENPVAASNDNRADVESIHQGINEGVSPRPAPLLPSWYLQGLL